MMPDEIRRITREIASLSPEAKALGYRIRAARRRLGLNARELAAMAGCSPVTIYHTEVGRYVPGPELLWRIAMAIGQSADDLLGLPPVSTSAEPKEILQSFAALAETLGYPATSIVAKPPEKWPAPVREYVAALMAFGARPSSGRLSAALMHHPVACDWSAQRALARLQSGQHADLVDLLLSGSTVALDTLEDVARRLIPALDRRGRRTRN